MFFRFLPLIFLCACTAATTLPPAQQSKTAKPPVVQNAAQPIAIRIGKLTGIPQNLADDLRQKLQTIAEQQSIEIVKDDRKPSLYTLQAEMSAVVFQNQTLVTHRWVVLDSNGISKHSYNLTDTQDSGSTFAWSGVKDETLETMAQSAISRFSAWQRTNNL